ncbi:MAG: phytoene/squalene synthase family protein [Bacteroidales bacterium]|nr:phytoene/squalene synthase family protein [Bacteroidales bacterium]
MIELYNEVSYNISKIITRSYSTSFSIAVGFLNPESRIAIFSIYAFVRLADEIVDTFHEYNKEELLNDFENDYYKSYHEGLSLNPVLHSFQHTVKKYGIPVQLIQAFLKSMKADLFKHGSYNKSEIKEYIHGSAEAVGLMCLYVFVRGDKALFEELKNPAMKLGSAFQKVNFLRDLKTDMQELGRNYFPELDGVSFSQDTKELIIRDIEADFTASLPGIRRLPKDAKIPVLIAYYYYLSLLHKIHRTPFDQLVNRRIRIPNFRKYLLLIKAYLVAKFGLI